MNNLIQQLSEKAGAKYFSNGTIVVADNGSSGNATQFVPQFAELIIQECMTTILKESKWYWDQDEFESSNAIQNAARRVKEQFRVKV